MNDEPVTWESFKKAVDDYLKKNNIDGGTVEIEYIDWSPGWVMELPHVHYHADEKTMSIS